MKYTMLLCWVAIIYCNASFSQPPHETIYVQTDQPAYLTGSGINIKAWVFRGNHLQPGPANLYVDLLNERRELLASTMLPVWHGEASGGLSIPSGIPESVCYLHAYTAATKVINQNHGYTIPVPVLSPGSGEGLIRDTVFRWKASVHVEGGRLLSAQPTKVAVRMHAASPVSFRWSAEIRNRAGQVVAALKDRDDNIATGWLSPASGEVYMAYVKDQRGNERALPLPGVTDTGIHFKVTPGNTSIHYGILLRGVDPLRGPFTIRGIQQGQEVYAAKLNRDRVEVAGSIPVDSLARGTLYLELLDASGSLLADRLCYVHVPEMPLSQVFDSLSVPAAKRAMQVFRVRPNERFQRVFAFARSMVDPRLDEPENLYSRLYLSSLSAEPFIRPARYFQGDSLLHLLDALYICLSDEYRSQMEATPKISYQVWDSLLTFRGVAYDRKGPLVEQDIDFIIETEGQRSIFRQVKTDQKGLFRLENLYFMDSANVFFQHDQAKDREKNDIAISMVRDGGPARQPIYLPASGWVHARNQSVTKDRFPAGRFLDASNTEQDLAEKFKTMEEIRVTARKRSLAQQLDRELSSGFFRTEDYRIIDLVNDHPEAVGFTNVFSFLQGKLPPLQFVADKNGELVPYFRNRPISVMVDEMPFSTSLANLIVPANVAMVKFINYSFTIGGPVLAIYTRLALNPTINPARLKGLNTVAIQGYGKEQPRIQPDYRDPELGGIKRDNRINLYWHHPLYEGESGRMETIRFFRNDTGQPYRLTVVGVQDNGVPVLLTDRVF